MTFKRIKTMHENGASWSLMYILHPLKARIFRYYIYFKYGK